MPEITSIFAKRSKVTVLAEITQEDYNLIEKYSTISKQCSANVVYARRTIDRKHTTNTKKILQEQHCKQACGMTV